MDDKFVVGLIIGTLLCFIPKEYNTFWWILVVIIWIPIIILKIYEFSEKKKTKNK